MQKIQEMGCVLSEIEFILKHSDESLQKKVPQSFWNYIEENKEEEYQVTIDMSIPLENQNMKEDTKNLMAIIYRNYFCAVEEKKEYDEILNENQKKYEQKYSYDNLFKNNKLGKPVQEEQPTENLQMIEYKEENILVKMINRVKAFLRKLHFKH